MELISDLHIHSRHSQATSIHLDIDSLEKYARLKGVNLLGTGDFTHPKWILELKEKLSEDGSGILKTKSGFPFVLQTEISLIYSQGGKGRRIHNLVLAPDLDTVKQITDYLLTKGRIDYDGRPIFKIPCPEFVESLRKINKDIEVVPAHIWTPWFSMFGSKSGFDTVQECFQDQTKYINSLETGLSSDPAMNWRLSQLDGYNLISSSDLHSFWPWRMGREATILDLKKLDYKSLLKAVRTGEGIKSTIEVDPNYGKYHFDGHRKCNVCLDPKATLKHKGICPVCGKDLTIGVAYRVEQLADREEGFRPKNSKPFRALLPLSELISHIVGTALTSKKVWEIYNQFTMNSSEYDILLNKSESELTKIHEKIGKAIMLNREGLIKVSPGYDGEYGIPILGEQKPENKVKVIPKHKVRQVGLDEF